MQSFHDALERYLYHDTHQVTPRVVRSMSDISSHFTPRDRNLLQFLWTSSAKTSDKPVRKDTSRCPKEASPLHCSPHDWYNVLFHRELLVEHRHLFLAEKTSQEAFSQCIESFIEQEEYNSEQDRVESLSVTSCEANQTSGPKPCTALLSSMDTKCDPVLFSYMRIRRILSLVSLRLFALIFSQYLTGHKTQPCDTVGIPPPPSPPHHSSTTQRVLQRLVRFLTPLHFLRNMAPSTRMGTHSGVAMDDANAYDSSGWILVGSATVSLDHLVSETLKPLESTLGLILVEFYEALNLTTTAVGIRKREQKMFPVNSTSPLINGNHRKRSRVPLQVGLNNVLVTTHTSRGDGKRMNHKKLPAPPSSTDRTSQSTLQEKLRRTGITLWTLSTPMTQQSSRAEDDKVENRKNNTMAPNTLSPHVANKRNNLRGTKDVQPLTSRSFGINPFNPETKQKNPVPNERKTEDHRTLTLSLPEYIHNLPSEVQPPFESEGSLPISQQTSALDWLHGNEDILFD